MITTILFGVEGGIPELPAALVPYFQNTTGDYWVASFDAPFLVANGVTPTPAGDALTAQYIVDIKVQGRDYGYFLGSGTVPCYELLLVLLDADFVDNGPTASASPSINNKLRQATYPDGSRKVRMLLQTSDQSDVSVVPSNVVAGQDPLEASLAYTGLTADDVEVEVV